MEMKKIDVHSLGVSQVVSLMELAQGIAVKPPQWEKWKGKLAQNDAWGFFDGEELVGYGLVDGRCPYLSGSVRLLELRYRWQYNREPEIAWMVRSLARAYEKTAEQLVLDVNIKRELNGELYRKMGFKPSFMRSFVGKENTVMICKIKELRNL